MIIDDYLMSLIIWFISKVSSKRLLFEVTKIS